MLYANSQNRIALTDSKSYITIRNCRNLEIVNRMSSNSKSSTQAHRFIAWKTTISEIYNVIKRIRYILFYLSGFRCILSGFYRIIRCGHLYAILEMMSVDRSDQRIGNVGRFYSECVSFTEGLSIEWEIFSFKKNA